MAETIAEVFIRLGTSGVGDAQKKIEGVEKSLQDLGQSAKLAFTAMNPQIIDSITAKQDELRQKFDAGSISIHEFVAELRALGQESKVALASFGQRESMAGGILSRFGLGPDANQQAEAAKKLIEQLTAAGHYTPEQQGALFSAVDLKRDEALYGEALDNMVRQRQQQATEEERILKYQSQLRENSLKLEQKQVDEKTRRQIAALNQVSKEMSDGLKKEASEREAAQKRALQAVSREMSVGVKEVRKGEAEAIQQENAAKLRGIEITRQFETEQERFDRVKAEYIRLLIAGKINLQTYDRALLHLNATLDHNSNLMATGKKMTGMAGVGFQQLSYAAQDFVQVMDQGVGRALQASANNLSMVIPLLVKSASLGAGLAIGFTALATAVTMWERSSKKAESAQDKQAKSLERLTEALKRYSDARSRQLSIEDIAAGDEPGDATKKIAELQRQIVTEKGLRKIASEELSQNRAAEVERMTGGAIKGDISDPLVAEQFRKRSEDRILGELIATATMEGAPVPDVLMKNFQEQARIRAFDELHAANKAIEATENVAKARKEQVGALQRQLDAEKDIAKLREAERDAARNHFDNLRREQFLSEFDRANQERQDRMESDRRERFEAASRRRDTMSSIERGMMSDPMQRAMSVFDDFQRNVETIAGGGGGPEEIAAAGGLFQNQLDALVKDNKPQFRPGMTGFSEFGQQFQQALFQDPAEKDRKEQLRLQREANDYAKQMAESLAGGLVSGPALFGGGGGN